MQTRDDSGGPGGSLTPVPAIPWAAVRAVLFDLDGTLVETDIDFAGMRRATLEAAARHGAAVEDLAALDVLRIVATAAARVRAAAPFHAEVETLLQAIELEAGAGAREMPGARQVLAALEERGLGVGIVTRNCAAAAQQSLARAGLACELLLTRADVPRVKPDPVHLLIAAERLGAAPGATVVGGDPPLGGARGR